MKYRSLIPFVLVLVGPALSQAAGLQDAATGMAKDAATNTGKSAAKGAAKSMVPKDVTGAAAAAKDAGKTSKQAKKATGAVDADKASSTKKSKEVPQESSPMDEEVIPAGEE